MKRLFSNLCVCASLFALLYGCNAGDSSVSSKQTLVYNLSSPESVGVSSERLQRVDSVCNLWVADSLLPHLEAMIVRHGEVVFHKAYGMRDIEKGIPLQKGDIFRNASQSKAITSVALMTLYEQGHFLLDDPISKFIPEFKNPQVLDKMSDDGLSYTSHPAAREITFRDLLTTRSGISYATLWGHPTYNLCKAAGIPNISSKDSITIGEAVKLYAKIPLEAEPGSKWIYGWNWDIAGYLIEIMSGMPFDEYMKTYVLDPIGMKDTHFYQPEENANRLVTIYEKRGENAPIIRCDNELYQTYPISGAKTFFSGGGGLSGTVEDYAKFCQMLINKGSFNGHQILGRKTVEMMTQNQLGSNNDAWGWGLGFEVDGKDKEKETLTSQGCFSWSGMFNTFYMCDPKEDMTFFLYWNGLNYYNPALFERYRVMVYQTLID